MTRHYLYELHLPRPFYPADMSSEERALMQAHKEYWTEQLHRGRVVAMGAVAKADAFYEVGILDMRDGSDPHDLAGADPAITAKAGFTFKISPVPFVLRPGE
jgi:hypothetical protein